MPTWLKIVLGVLIGSVVICGGVMGACALFVKGKADDMKAGSEEAKKLGETGGAKACLDRSLEKTKECSDTKSMSGAICVTTATGFMQICLDSAKDKTALCDDGPAKGEDGNAWLKRRCTEAGQAGNDGCQTVMSLAFAHCNFGNPTPKTGDTPEEEAAPTDDKQDEAPTEEPADGTTK